MQNEINYTLKIDDEFKHFIPPLSQDEKSQLEENIIRDGCREPLSVWNKTILDGHNRYEICMRNKIPFEVTYIFLKSREEAIAWICANQLGRRNITDETRRYLIGKRYEIEKILGAHNTAGINQYTGEVVRAKMLPKPLLDGTSCRTKERLGKEYRISHATVDKYRIYAHAVDILSKAEPELFPKILSGTLKISQGNVIELSRLPASDIRLISAHLSEQPAELISYSNMRDILPKKSSAPKPQLSQTTAVSVKNMPAYDPDAEILSIALTIPSWVSSINRVRSAANIKEVSDNARLKLVTELKELKSVTEAMLSAIMEENQ